MAMTGAIWYQGEANVGGAAYYSCGFPSMISRWREAFKNSALWFGFVQIAGYRHSTPYGRTAPCRKSITRTTPAIFGSRSLRRSRCRSSA